VDRCPGGLVDRGDIGVRRLRCVGPAATCTINLPARDGVPVHHFSVEPVVVELAPAPVDDGPKIGDVLVAVDSTLITTQRGGRLLATLAPGAPVRLLVRRDGRLRELTFVAARGCGITSLQVSRP
jgi:S1-C subfamily serine protease